MHKVCVDQLQSWDFVAYKCCIYSPILSHQGGGGYGGGRDQSQGYGGQNGGGWGGGQQQGGYGGGDFGGGYGAPQAGELMLDLIYLILFYEGVFRIRDD